MKKIFILGLIFIFSFLLVGASEIDEEIQKLKDFSGEELPGIAGKLFGNERINLYITNNEGEEIIVGIITEDKKFKDILNEEVENPTLIAYTDEAILRDIGNSEDVLGSFENALSEKRITYKAVGLGNKIKFGFLRVLASVTGWFR
jgi:hypothetical protein